jgi:hypothetical protein
MNEEKTLTQQESLSIIQQMLHQAKNEQKDDGKGWIVWGWMLFAASVLTVLNIRLAWFNETFLFWNVFGIITVVYFVYETVMFFFFKKTKRVRTYTGDLFAKLNVGFFISLMFIIVSINVGARILDDMTPVNIGFCMLISLYAFWILIYGTALNFRPSIIGAYASWGLGFGAMFSNNFEVVMICHAVAVLVGYIIPGHIANREFKKLHRKETL